MQQWYEGECRDCELPICETCGRCHYDLCKRYVSPCPAEEAAKTVSFYTKCIKCKAPLNRWTAYKHPFYDLVIACGNCKDW